MVMTVETFMMPVPVMPTTPERLGNPADATTLAEALSGAISPGGTGLAAARELYEQVVAGQSNWQGHVRSLAYVPNAPCSEAIDMDRMMASASYMGTSWVEAAGAIAAENQAIRFMADQIGFGPGAGGTFLSGGTIANVTALAVAAAEARRVHPGRVLAIAASGEVHSSVRMAARMLGLTFIQIATRDLFRMQAADLAVLDRADQIAICAVVATAGTTNAGYIDDLAGIGAWCRERGTWFHVDGAYGGAALLVPGKRAAFAGIELADSVVIDPHKWLFATLDSSMLIYRNPERARRLFGQQADYIESAVSNDDWNPADYGPHFTRRCRGLPLWYSLVARGVTAIAADVARGLSLAQQTAALIRECEVLELVTEPELSIVLFRRVGWSAADYGRWASELLEAGVAFVAPTTVHGTPAARLCFINPATTIDDVRTILGPMLRRTQKRSSRLAAPFADL